MDETGSTCNQLNSCMFFSAGKLARVFGKAADNAFRITGLSPSHAFLLYIVNQNSGIHQKIIGEILHMTPSTITRFVEKLENKGLVTRKSEGKNVHLFTTGKGIRLQPDIITAWRNLHDSYSGIITPGEAEEFISTASKIISKLDEDSVLQE